MATMKPFQSIRPRADLAPEIAALPYDVYNREEARAVVESNPMSFLKIDRAETLFPETVDMYSQPVYDKARDTLNQMIECGAFVQDRHKCYYVYELTMDGHSQTGLVGCASIDDYLNHVIMKHENTREDKETDRIRHVDTCSAQTGPIFLAYRSNAAVKEHIAAAKKQPPLYDFISEDGISHKVWCIYQPIDVAEMEKSWEQIPAIYIADGHHRAASAVKVGLKRRAKHPDYDGTEEFNYFLSVSFPDDELRILDYNRVVKDLNGHTFTELLDLLRDSFDITLIGKEAYSPKKKGTFGLYGNGNWYCMEVKDASKSEDPVNGLDVSVLQNIVLQPLLGIEKASDSRIRFVGGIRGLDFLSQCIDEMGDGAAFAMFPTSMNELLNVADAKLLMPAKSTWFEPKLRSGLFIHQI